MALLPKVKLKVLPTFPANVLDGTGVDIVKQNGSYQFNLAYDDFAPPITSITDPTHQNALLWNNVTNSYVLVPVSTLIAGSVFPATVLPLVESGGGIVGTGVKYAREDHVHPASPVPAASAISFIQAGTGAVTRTMQDKARERVSVKDYGAVGDGIADDTAAIATAWTAVLAMSPMPALVFPTGIYKATTFPNFAVSHARIVGEGVVTLRYNGVATAAIFMDGTGGTGVYDVRFGPFLIEAPASTDAALRIAAVHHSHIDVDIRGAGVFGVHTKLCVCTEFVVKCSINEGSWYSVTAPTYGVMLDQIAANQPTSYCLFRNPVIEGSTYGIYALHALGNIIMGGTSEGCGTGVFFDTPSTHNKIIGSDFEVNSTIDVQLGGTCNALLDCDSEAINIVGTMCLMRGGAHNNITIAGSSTTASIDGVKFNKYGTGTFTNSGTGSIINNCINFTTAAVTGKVDTFGVTVHGNSNYTILPTDRSVGLNAVLTAARTWTLPLSSSVTVGALVRVFDLAGGIGGANTITVNTQGGDFLGPGGSKVISAAYGSAQFICAASGLWVAIT